MSVPDPPPVATLLTNIDGTTDLGYLGHSVSMNADGSIVAIGGFDLSSDSTGHVQVWKNVNGTWTQLGVDIPVVGGAFVSLDSTGYVVAIAGFGTQYTGYVRVYQYVSNAWQQMGDEFNGAGTYNYFGVKGNNLSLSSDGTTVAIGAPNNTNGGGTYAGQAQVWRYANSAWTQLGTNIDGSSGSQQFGISVDLSSDGNIVAIGGHEPGTGNGIVKVYQFDSTWTQIGSFTGTSREGLGYSVSLSSDGTIVAMGAPLRSGYAGKVRVYLNDNGTWTSMGSEIAGISAGDQSGRYLSLSSDGTMIAIGTNTYDRPAGNGYDPGQYGPDNEGLVRVYQYLNDTWNQIHEDILGDTRQGEAGYVSLSGDGNLLALGAPGLVANKKGRVSIYELSPVSSGPDLTGFQPAATTAVNELADITDATTANDKSQAALAAVADDTEFSGKTAAEKRTLVRQVMAQALASAAGVSVDKFEVATATFASFFADIDVDAKAALDSAPTVEVVAPGSNTTVTADAAVYCPLQNGETITMQFDGASVTWSMADDLLTPSVTAGTLSTGNAALASGATTTLTSDSGSVFHFFAGSVGGAADSSGGGSGDPFLRPILA